MAHVPRLTHIDAVPADRPKPKPTTFLLWGEDDSAIGFQKRYKAPQHIPAPKLKLPGHAASYNPPDEYLLTDEEKKAWCVRRAAPCSEASPPSTYAHARTFVRTL